MFLSFYNAEIPFDKSDNDRIIEEDALWTFSDGVITEDKKDNSGFLITKYDYDDFMP